MTQALGIIVLLYVACRLPSWLEHFGLSWYVHNWVAYRHWTSCRHEHVEEVCTPVNMGGVSAVCEYICQACGIALLRDTPAIVSLSAEDRQRILKQVTWQHQRDARLEQLRVVLVRGVLPLGREYWRLCTVIGTGLVTLVLVLWLAWKTVGPIIDKEWHQTLRGYCVAHGGIFTPEEPLP